MTTTSRPRRSVDDLTTLDEFLDAEGIKDEATVSAVKRVIALQLDQEIRTKRLTKADLARRMRTSRAQVDRMLDPEHGNITLETLARAARVLGRSIKLELV
jgi:antitoxin HicB